MNTFVDETCRQWIQRHRLTDEMPVLEVGSLDVNGSLRQYFTGGSNNIDYWGVDMTVGPGVDQVLQPGWTADDLPMLDRTDVGQFHVAVWTEAAEHDPDPFHTAREIGRALRPGGVLLATTCGYTPDGRCAAWHDYPYDLWRFSPTGWRHVIERAGLRVLAQAADGGRDFTVAAFARKDPT